MSDLFSYDHVKQNWKEYTTSFEVKYHTNHSNRRLMLIHLPTFNSLAINKRDISRIEITEELLLLVIEKHLESEYLSVDFLLRWLKNTNYYTDRIRLYLMLQTQN